MSTALKMHWKWVLLITFLQATLLLSLAVA